MLGEPDAISPLQPIGPHLDSNSNKPKKKNYRQLEKCEPVLTANSTKELLLVCNIFKGKNLYLLKMHIETYTDEIK